METVAPAGNLGPWGAAAPELCPELGGGGTGSSVPACGSLLTQSQNPTGTRLALGAPRDPCGGCTGCSLFFLDPGSWPPPPREPHPDRDAGSPPRAQQEALGGSCREQGAAQPPAPPAGSAHSRLNVHTQTSLPRGPGCWMGAITQASTGISSHGGADLSVPKRLQRNQRRNR